MATSIRRLSGFTKRGQSSVACYNIHRRSLHYGPRLRNEIPLDPDTKAKDGPDPVLSMFDSPAFESFQSRHIGPVGTALDEMLQKLDPPARSMEHFIHQVLPKNILTTKKLNIPSTMTFPGPSPRETAAGSELKRDGRIGRRYRTTVNTTTEAGTAQAFKELGILNYGGQSYYGCGYHNTVVPPVIQRNVLENPAWYTSYTPYQPEISQGRLESLLNYQTMITDLTGMEISNASILDEGTAAAEAMALSLSSLPSKRQALPGKTYLVSDRLHPQTIAVLRARAEGLDIRILAIDMLKDGPEIIRSLKEDLLGVMVQYPDTRGGIFDYSDLARVAHDSGVLFAVATDLLALTLLKPPGEFGADIVLGSAQRFGVPMGFGGPHAAFFACSDKYKRKIPGRLIGRSRDRLGNSALRLALQTREQHIRREKATSNICTAQALLANMSAFYAIHHGPQGLTSIASKIVQIASVFRQLMRDVGHEIDESTQEVCFDTVLVKVHASLAQSVRDQSHYLNRLIRDYGSDTFGVSFNELSLERPSHELNILVRMFLPHSSDLSEANLYKEVMNLIRKAVEGMNASDPMECIPQQLRRTTLFLQQPVFNDYHSETELLRYMHQLQSKDLSLVHTMIPLGSCTMKLNATSEMLCLSQPGFSDIHPFTPPVNTRGYQKLIRSLESDLAEITGFSAVTLQPNSGAQGEFTGLRIIRKYQEMQSGKKRDICLIPVSAHGTNPASAAMAGMRVVPLKCEPKTGNLDLEDLKEKCQKYHEELGAIMITYPSTFGVFEPEIKQVCEIVHEHGGQVYMDGANLNAQIGLCSPGEIGADVCHLNLHKTFCIPHGGGGPGVGPVGVKEHLAPFLPGHPIKTDNGPQAIDPVSSAPWGSASILPISWAYIKMMGGEGLTQATRVALLNANYMMSRLSPHYPILYTNSNKRCAHEFVLDVRKFQASAGIQAIDIAKRLQDYGLHAPTMSWPVANTLMIEPTESEGKPEMDRYCDALISIREEIQDIEEGRQPKEGNMLKMAPHTQPDLLIGEWDRPYTREMAAYPVPWLKKKKFWPSVARLDDTYGDMNLFCTCEPVEGAEDMTGAAAPMPT